VPKRVPEGVGKGTGVPFSERQWAGEKKEGLHLGGCPIDKGAKNRVSGQGFGLIGRRNGKLPEATAEG